MPEGRENRARSKETPARKRGIVFELENVAIKGRPLLYETTRAALEEKGIELTPMLFSRHGVGTSLKNCLSVVVQSAGKPRVSIEKLHEAAAERFRAALDADGATMSEDFRSLLRRGVEQGVSMGALSMLDSATAVRLMEKLGLSEMNVKLFLCSSEKRNAPSPDSWLKLAKAMAVPPCRCAAFTTSAASCRTALAAGMYAVAVPDEFTRFEDFGGADTVVDSFSRDVMEEVLRLLGS